jgi:hypothetical protein
MSNHKQQIIFKKWDNGRAGCVLFLKSPCSLVVPIQFLIARQYQIDLSKHVHNKGNPRSAQEKVQFPLVHSQGLEGTRPRFQDQQKCNGNFRFLR